MCKIHYSRSSETHGHCSLLNHVIAHCYNIPPQKHEMFGTFKDKQCQIKKDIRYEMYSSQSLRLRKLCKMPMLTQITLLLA